MSEVPAPAREPYLPHATGSPPYRAALAPAHPERGTSPGTRRLGVRAHVSGRGRWGARWRGSTAYGTFVGVALTAAATAALIPFRHGTSRATPALIFVLPVVAAGVLGRRLAALVTALAAAAVFSFAFVPPYDRVSINQPEDAAALVVFLVVALVVGTLVAFEADRRQAAEERSDEMRRLFERNQELIEERERLREEAAQAELVGQIAEQRSALLRSVSHDLRTPLGTIQAVASDLRDGTAYAPETRDLLLELVAEEAARLNRIVTNLLSMSRIDTGSFAPDRQAVALDELVSERVTQLQRVLAERMVIIEVPSDLPLISADYTQLDQVISNLLENVARHTPPGTKVVIHAAAVGSMMEVTVDDDGPGIPADLRATVFQPFHGGHDSSSTGVGLTICRSIIDAHGGAISIDPSESGTTIRFTVPLHG